MAIIYQDCNTWKVIVYHNFGEDNQTQETKCFLREDEAKKFYKSVIS